MTAFDFLILSLAVWRVAVFLTVDDGPWKAFARLRMTLLNWYGLEVLECPYCASVWLAVLAWLLWLAWPAWTLLLAIPLAIAGAVAAFHKLTYDRDPPQDSMLRG